MNDSLQHLCELEAMLHRPEVRRDPVRLGELLHESFVEFGRSGKRYDKAEVVAHAAIEKSQAPIRAQDFEAVRIGDDIVLVTYKSAQDDGKGVLSRHALRSSLWQRTGGGWRLRLHQATPTAAFEKPEA